MNESNQTMSKNIGHSLICKTICRESISNHRRVVLKRKKEKEDSRRKAAKQPSSVQAKSNKKSKKAKEDVIGPARVQPTSDGTGSPRVRPSSDSAGSARVQPTDEAEYHEVKFCASEIHTWSRPSLSWLNQNAQTWPKH